MRHSLSTVFATSLTALTAAGFAQADGHESAPQDLGAALTGGKFDINIRFRWEHVNQQGFSKEANALTVRPRIGYTTGKYHGASAKVSVQANLAADESQYNAASTNGVGNRPVIADPVGAGVDQLWIDYDFSELNEDIKASARVGRQVITLDDHRFVGHVGWRNLWQTFDAATVKAAPVEGLDLFYSYVYEVNRIFNDDDLGNPALTDFDSDTHLLNASYAIAKGHKLTGFAYFMDLTNLAGAVNSNQTFGARYTGKSAINEDVSLAYAASYARQSDYGDSPLSYDADYYAAEVKGLFGASFVGGGFEVLGADGTSGSFRTPLATLHKFNGFADVFLVTPGIGLRDYYVTTGTKIPDSKTSLAATFHYFTGDEAGAEYLGNEIDAVVVQPITDYAKALFKAAYFAGNGGAGNTVAGADVFKFIAQIELTF